MASTAAARQLQGTAARSSARPVLMAGTLAAADICATGLAVIAGFRVWSLMNPAIPPFQWVMSLAPLFCALMFAFENLYPGIGMGAVEHIRRVFRGITLVYLMLTAAMFMTKDRSWAESRGGIQPCLGFLPRACPVGALVLRPDIRPAGVVGRARHGPRSGGNRSQGHPESGHESSPRL